MVDHFHDVLMVLDLEHETYLFLRIVWVSNMLGLEAFLDEIPVNGVIL
jgi:hypothetical protein